MKNRSLVPALAIAALMFGVLAVFATAPAEAQCLSQEQCDQIKQQLRQHRDDAQADRQKVRDMKRQAKDLPRGSEERKQLRREAKEAKKQLRQGRRDNGIGDLKRQFRDGCRNC